MSDNSPDNLNGDTSRPPVFHEQEWNRIVADCKLSERQGQIVGYLMQSRTRGEIQQALNIRPSALRTHYDRARLRLQARDTMEMAMRIFETYRRLFG